MVGRGKGAAGCSLSWGVLWGRADTPRDFGKGQRAHCLNPPPQSPASRHLMKGSLGCLSNIIFSQQKNLREERMWLLRRQWKELSLLLEERAPKHCRFPEYWDALGMQSYRDASRQALCFLSQHSLSFPITQPPFLSCFCPIHLHGCAQGMKTIKYS